MQQNILFNPFLLTDFCLHPTVLLKLGRRLVAGPRILDPVAEVRLLPPQDLSANLFGGLGNRLQVTGNRFVKEVQWKM